MKKLIIPFILLLCNCLLADDANGNAGGGGGTPNFEYVIAELKAEGDIYLSYDNTGDTPTYLAYAIDESEDYIVINNAIPILEQGNIYTIEGPFTNLSYGEHSFHLKTYGSGGDSGNDDDRRIYTGYFFNSWGFLINTTKTNMLLEPYNTIEEVETVISSQDIDKFSSSIMCVDVFGRKKQLRHLKASPDKESLITIYEYDNQGRQDKEFLPFAYNFNANVTENSITQQHEKQSNFYSIPDNYTIPQDNKPYTEIIYENAPLNRVLEEVSSGESWCSSRDSEYSHSIKYNNHMNEDLEVRKWTNNGNPDGYYAENEILIETTTDENGKISYEYKTKSEQTILKRSYKNGEPIDTYYIYDTKGNLIYLLTPEASSQICSDGTIPEEIMEKYVTRFWYDNQNRLVKKKIPEASYIKYIYDDLDRIVLCQDGNLRSNYEWTFTKYDRRGNVIMTGIYYDQNHYNHEALQDEISNRGRDGLNSLFEKKSSDLSDYGYTNNAYPDLAYCKVLSVNYYDDLEHKSQLFDLVSTGGYNYIQSQEQPFSDNSCSNRTKGKLMANFTRVIQAENNYLINWGNHTFSEPPPTISPDEEITYEKVYYKGDEIRFLPGFETNADQELSIGAHIDVPATPVDLNWAKTLHFYDKFGREIQTISTNHVLNQYSINEVTYDFVGKVTFSKASLMDANGNTELYKTKKRFEYDHAQRLKREFHTVNNQAEVLLIQNNYNEIGQLIEKNLYSTDYDPENPESASFLQSVDFRYNIRGWLTHINGTEFTDNGEINDDTNDLFGMDFYYEESYSDLNTTPQMNGNISAVSWKSHSDMKKRVYGYEYDEINQLHSAEYAHYNVNQNVVRSNEYSVDGLNYDLNGNIKSINRKGPDGNAEGYIDKLSYHYNGNQLIAVNDENSGQNEYDFCDNGVINNPNEPDFTEEYLYDSNGNITQDKNKGIDITYNHLNLPTIVDYGNGNRIEWVYSASGAKLRKYVYNGNEINYYQDYLGGFCFKTTYSDEGYPQKKLEYITHEEGKIKRGTDDFYYVFDYKDHLGNIRVSYIDNGTGNADIVQEDHYYPFGMRLANLCSDSGNDNKHLYNGKELEDDFNLNWYHYGARYYDPQLCKWLQVDPADEFFSAYVYCHNDPVNFVDKDGLFESHSDIVIADALNTLVFYVPYLNQKYSEQLKSGNLNNNDIRFIVYQAYGACKDDEWKLAYNSGQSRINPSEKHQINESIKVIQDIVIEDLTGMIATYANLGEQSAEQAISEIHWSLKVALTIKNILTFFGLADAEQYDGVTEELN